MFLNKKNAIYYNKPKSQDPAKQKRILGGWQEDGQQKQDNIDYTKKQQAKPKVSFQSLLEGEDMTESIQTVIQEQKSQKSLAKEIYYLDWDQLDARTDIQCQKKLIEEIVQPGGIRIKPSEAQLSEFLKESKGMETHVVGSLLLSKIQVNYPFQIKAKALYTIQHLVKKNQKYAAYFKAHSQKMRNFPQPEDNVDNYRKILKQALNSIGISSLQGSVKNQPELTFVDPGYNDEPTKKISDMRTFINQNSKKQKKTQTKKAIIGPGQARKDGATAKNQKYNEEFLVLDLLGTGNVNQPKNVPTFDQLLGNPQKINVSQSNDLI